MGIQRMNKRGFEFKSGLFAIIAVSLMIIAFGVIISSQDDVYNSGATSELSSLNKLDDVSDISANQRNRITPNDPSRGDDAEANTFKGVYGILTGMFSAFDLVIGNDGMIDQISDKFGIPSYVRQGIVTFILISIALSLVAIIFRLARPTA